MWKSGVTDGIERHVSVWAGLRSAVLAGCSDGRRQKGAGRLTVQVRFLVVQPLSFFRCLHARGSWDSTCSRAGSGSSGMKPQHYSQMSYRTAPHQYCSFL
jgi:hypothetical protein